MKKILFLISCLIAFQFLNSFNELLSPEPEKRFGIYLLKNDTLTTYNVQETALDKLILAYKPNISYNDITAYDFTMHKLYLNEKPAHYFGTDTVWIFSRVLGTPFVVVAMDERIYLGSFHTLISSWLPKTPMVIDLAVDNPEKSIVISRAPIFNDSLTADVRSDKRIYQALRSKIIQ